MYTLDLSTFPSIAEQIAAIPPADSYEIVTIFSITLPTGEIISRHTFDGAPYDGVMIARGNVEADVTPSGWVAFIAIGDFCIDDILAEDLENIPAFLEDLYTRFDDDEASAEDWANVRALLNLDLTHLGTLAQLPPEVESAIEVWNNLPSAEIRHIAQTVGFGAWYAARELLVA